MALASQTRRAEAVQDRQRLRTSSQRDRAGITEVQPAVPCTSQSSTSSKMMKMKIPRMTRSVRIVVRNSLVVFADQLENVYDVVHKLQTGICDLAWWCYPGICLDCGSEDFDYNETFVRD